MTGNCKCGGKCKPTINPAVSEAQRRYLNVTKGHDWVKSHEFDNEGKLPEYVGDDNKGTQNMRKSFWQWLSESVGAAPATLQRPIVNAKKKECPECGGDIDVEGECEDCGYVANSATNQPSDPDASVKGVGKRGDGNQSLLSPRRVGGAVEADEPDDHTPAALDEGAKDMASKGATSNKMVTVPADYLSHLIINSNPEGKNQYSGSISGGGKKGGLPVGDGSRVSAKQDMRKHLRDQKAKKEKEDNIENDGTSNNEDFTVNWLNLLSHDPRLVTNMPAGGAFSGAKAAGFSAAQAAAMAGKLEGSYDSGGGSGKGGSKETSDAKEASAHAEKTKSKSAHKAAASAHKSAAEHHKGEGNDEMAASHMSASRSHAAKAARMTRNDLVPSSVINSCTCPMTRQFLIALNAKAEGSNATATGSGDVEVGGYDEDDADKDDAGWADDEGNLDADKSAKKLKTIAVGNSEVSQYGVELYNRERAALIGQLTSNAAPQHRATAVADLSRRTLADLRSLSNLMPTRNRQTQQQPQPMYLGAGVVANGRGSDDDITANGADDLLDVPTLNFEEISKENQRRQA